MKIALLTYIAVIVQLTAAYVTLKHRPDEDLQDFITLMEIINKPRVPEKYKVGLEANLKSFSWKNCGHPSDLVTINMLMVGPNKIKVPGNITFSGSAIVNAALDSPISLSLKIKKKVFVWVDIPCIDNLGSCSYDDACALIAPIDCPTGFADCHCPFKAGPITVTNGTMYIDESGIPSWLKDGDYQVEARATYKGKEVLCLEMDLTLG